MKAETNKMIGWTLHKMKSSCDSTSQTNSSPTSSTLTERSFSRLHNAYAEVWQENETSIVLKMLDESLKMKDQPRFNALKRSLLEIEKKPTGISVIGDEFTLSPQSDSKPSFDPVLEEMKDFSKQEQQYLEKAIKQNVKQYDAQINIMIVGDGRTGKTSIMRAFLGQNFQNDTPRSIGLDSKIIYKGYKGKKIKYKFIDTDSDKSREFIKKVYYDMASAIVPVYDITNKETFEGIKFWSESIRKHTTNEPMVFLVGNKVDLKGKRSVAKKMAMKYAKQNNMHYSEVSAKDPISIQILMRKITAYVLDSEKEPGVRAGAEEACVGCAVL